MANANMPPRRSRASDAPLAVGFQQDFGVAMGAKDVAALFQSCAERLKIVDFAVEYDRIAAIGRVHRLRAGFEINDRKPRMAQSAMAVGIEPNVLRIGASMCQRHRHRLNRLLPRRHAEACYATNAAHTSPRPKVINSLLLGVYSQYHLWDGYSLT